MVKNDLIAASVLSGNRNFEARVHSSVKANFLMSPPLVVAFALAGRVDINLTTEPLGKDKNGSDVYLRDLWPTLQEVRDAMKSALKPEVFRTLYKDFAAQNPAWNEIPSSVGDVYRWDSQKHVHPGAAVLRELLDAAGHDRRDQGRLRARRFWRFRDDRPHLARRQLQERLARRQIPRRARRAAR